MNKTEEKTVRITINELSKSYCYAMARVAELEKALRATHVIISQNRGLTLCQGSEWVYILKEINAALDGKGGI